MNHPVVVQPATVLLPSRIEEQMMEEVDGNVAYVAGAAATPRAWIPAAERDGGAG